MSVTIHQSKICLCIHVKQYTEKQIGDGDESKSNLVGKEIYTSVARRKITLYLTSITNKYSYFPKKVEVSVNEFVFYVSESSVFRALSQTTNNFE